MRLFIAEKPRLAKEIAKGLGVTEAKHGYYEIKNTEDIVTWAYGHILRQKNPNEYSEAYKVWRFEDLPIVPENWQVVIADNCKEQFHVIKKLILEADEIVNAGDPDREGQLLIDEILDYVKNSKPVRRILLNALDEKSVKQALNHLRDNKEFTGLKNSALARSRADWLVGMNLSRAFTLAARKVGYSQVLSVGRVKTPTMALVVRREAAIKNFQQVQHYQLKIKWQHENGMIQSTWIPADDCSDLDENGRILKKSVMESLENEIRLAANKAGAYIQKREIVEKKENQRLPYSLSALQVEAGRVFGYDPQLVLDTVQKLYEAKLTTYPRSDCDFLPENQFSDRNEILKSLKVFSELQDAIDHADVSIQSRAWNDKKISAHHAIIPTCVKCDPVKLTEIEKDIYLLIAVAYVAQFYPEHIYRQTKISICCGKEHFTANGRIIVQNGWKVLYKNQKEDRAENEADLPQVNEGDTVILNEEKIAELVTKPPKRFTAATLLQAMKEIHNHVKNPALKGKLKTVSGIGTEATRAGIIDDLLHKGFLTVDKKNLIPTELAITMIDFLPDYVTYPDTTALWEDKLAQIVEGELSFYDFFEGQKEFVRNIVNEARQTKVEISSSAPKCPECGSVLIRKTGKNGFFWSCAGYPECKVAFPDEKGRPKMEKAPEAKCPKCHGVIRQINGKNGKFWGCKSEECKATFQDYRNKPVIYLCPKCKKGYLRKIKGSKGGFWSCNQYPTCKAVFQDAKGKPNL